jgi:hypothetical protein
MNLKTFTTLIEGIQSQSNKTHKLYKYGVDLLSFNEDYYRDVVNPLMIEAFGKEGVNWIDWYVYERDGKENMKAWDKDGNEICHNIESLYNEITK